MGLDQVAARLNAAGLRTWPTWNRNQPSVWHDLTIRRIVTSRAVRGEMDVAKYAYETRKCTEDGEEIEYEVAVALQKTGVTLKPYPSVIDEVTWQRANAALTSRATGRGRKGKTFTNLLQGLCRCSVCGGTMKLKKR